MQLPKLARVHLDTEFTDFVNCDLISIGLAADTGHEFYGENLDFLKPWASQWVQANIYPMLKPHEHGFKRTELSARVWQWIDDLPVDFVIISADYKSDFDLIVDLLDERHPKIIEYQNMWNCIYHWADMTTEQKRDDEYHNIVSRVRAKFHLYFLDYFFRTKETQHHALSDAKANREAWNKLKTEFGIPQ